MTFSLPERTHDRGGRGEGVQIEIFCVLPYTFRINLQEGGKGVQRGGFRG